MIFLDLELKIFSRMMKLVSLKSCESSFIFHFIKIQAIN